MTMPRINTAERTRACIQLAAYYCMLFILLSHLCSSSCDSLRFYKYLKAAVVLRKDGRAGLRFDRGKYGSFTVFKVYLRFPVVLCGCRTAENRNFYRVSVKGV